MAKVKYEHELTVPKCISEYSIYMPACIFRKYCPFLYIYLITLHPLLLMVQVCDEPHPLLIKEMLTHCVSADIDRAYQILKSLWDKGYSPHDIVTNIFRVCKNHQIAEYLKLEFIKV